LAHLPFSNFTLCLLFGVKASLSACYLPAWAAVVNFLVGQTHWKMGKQTVEDAKKRWSAGFAASEVNQVPTVWASVVAATCFCQTFFKRYFSTNCLLF
jgi:cytochrome c biogenesis protein CcdA